MPDLYRRFRLVVWEIYYGTLWAYLSVVAYHVHPYHCTIQQFQRYIIIHTSHLSGLLGNVRSIFTLFSSCLVSTISEGIVWLLRCYILKYVHQLAAHCVCLILMLSR